MSKKKIFNILGFSAILLCIIVLMSYISINIVNADEIRKEKRSIFGRFLS
jgi:CHASE3 domain sensor protein